MNPSKTWVALTAPVTMILALVVAIPLLFGAENDCDPALASTTGPTSGAVSIMSWNVCASSCGRWNQRIAPATEQVGRISPDILAVQEGGWGKDKRAPTFKGFGGLGYATANDKAPFIGRYIFYKPAKFDASKSGSIDLGGNHGMAWVNLRTKADGVEFTVVDVHLAFEKSADAKRKTQMTDGLAKVQADSGAKHKSRAFDAPAAVMKGDGYSDAVTVATNKLNEDVNSARGRDTNAPVNRDSNQTDHIYVPPGSSVASWQQVVNAEDGKYTAPFITDHNAIMATIGLPGSKPANPVKPDSITTDKLKDAKPGDANTGDAKPVANVEPTTAPAAPPTTVGRWKADQLKNAAAIVAAGKTLGVNQRGQTLAVMVAMGESNLQVIDRGDAAGPDSRGLFQQRDNWGTYEQRMDPTASATLFYQALLKVEGWADLQPTTAAHRVQRNADPNYYEKFWDDAVQVVASVTGQWPADAGFAAAPGCGGGEATDAVWASGADCDFGNISTPRSCFEALNEAARISRDSACTNEVRGGTWRRRCLEFVARTYGYASSGTPTAKAQFRLMESKGLISKNKKIPAGALVYFNSSDPAGHIAIYAGNGQAFSNDYVRPGCIDLTPMSSMGSNGRYLGWSPPVFPLAAPL
jgi:endonuclease/exonuclease/phosphatase family metal-dependent hydrolase